MNSAIHSIEISHIAKRYRLGASEQAIQLREQLLQLFKRPFNRASDEKDWIWALRDISFNAGSGEVIGIIGRNGAGKSTLLKILSRITHPTSGSVKVRGRVASLLEVGTGFHEELTGRENIYLNGSILGMRRREIDQRFDAIVEFSGIEQFLDTPIKRYSSGMRLRLGFAVAAHLEPDVLVVDEVLAVGDAAFQKKCITAMEGLRSGGRTVLFVSHNMAAVENLCSRGIWIDGGKVRMDTDARAVIKEYLATYAGEVAASSELIFDSRVGTGDVRFTKLEYFAADGTPISVMRSGEPLTLRMHFRVEKQVRHVSFGLRMFTDMGTLITDTSTWHNGISVSSVMPGEGYVDLSFDSMNLVAGRYGLSLWVSSQDGSPVYDGDVRATLEVDPSDVYGSGRGPDSRWGVVYFPQRWSLSGLLGETERSGRTARAS